MQRLLRGLVVAVGVTASGCATLQSAASSGAAVSDGYLGNWQGGVVQAGAPRPYPVEIDLYREPDGGLRAVSLYPQFGCVGKLTVRKAEPQKITFDEALEPAQHCGARREFTLIWGVDGRVLYASAKPPAQGTLLRAAPSVGMNEVLVKYFGAKSPVAASARSGTARPSVGELAQTVDSALVRWSQVWPADRYILGSPRIGEVYWKSQAYLVNGKFEVQRNGRKVALPFAAELQQGAGKPRLTGLCMQDGDQAQRCYDAERVLQETRQRDLKLLMAVGLVAMIANAAANAPQPVCEWVSEPADRSWANDTDGVGNPIYRSYQCEPQK